jgi:hypothetical protein
MAWSALGIHFNCTSVSCKKYTPTSEHKFQMRKTRSGEETKVPLAMRLDSRLYYKEWRLHLFHKSPAQECHAVVWR